LRITARRRLKEIERREDVDSTHSLFPRRATHPWLLRCCGSYEATEIRNFYSLAEAKIIHGL